MEPQLRPPLLTRSWARLRVPRERQSGLGHEWSGASTNRALLSLFPLLACRAAAVAEAPSKPKRRRRRRSAEVQENEAQTSTETPTAESSSVDAWRPFRAHLRRAQLEQGLKARKFFIGRLRCAKRPTGGVVFVPDVEEFTVVGLDHMNRAVDGDVVVIEPLGSTQENDAKAAAEEEADDQKPRARVVAINERSKREIGGTIYQISDLKEEDAEKLRAWNRVEADDCVFMPASERFPRMLLSRSEVLRQTKKIKDMRVTVVLTTWSHTCQLPRCRFERVVGTIGDLESETEIILMEYDVRDEPFTQEVNECLPPADYQIPAEEVAKRTDFRKLCIFSIDPPGCEDVDDALHCYKLANGNFSVGVHIADVTHFVRAGSELDREGAERATSVYLVNRRVDMLPRLLTTDICSLRCDGKDRLCFSVVFEMSPKAKVISASFEKGILRSRAALAYKEAQELLDTKSSDEIGQSIQHLAMLARQLREKRREDGALELEGGEMKFELDTNTQLPTNVFKYESYFANNLIEEFMLLANRTVAEELTRHYPKLSLLRRHPPPKARKMDDLVALLEAYGIKDFSYMTNKKLQSSLNAVEHKDDPFFNRLVREMATRCMEEAVYFCTGSLKQGDWPHYGLAMEMYTHFTSPIRRYADCVVHRLLSATLGVEKLPGMLQKKKEIEDCCEHLNYKNKNARWADRASVEFHLYQFFRKQGAVTVEGVVMRVMYEGISVAVEDYGAEGIAELDAKSWGVLKEEQLVYGRPNSKFQDLQIKVFDRVIVKIEADPDDLTHRLLRFTFLGKPRLLPNGSKAPMPQVPVLPSMPPAPATPAPATPAPATPATPPMAAAVQAAEAALAAKKAELDALKEDMAQVEEELATKNQVKAESPEPKPNT